MYIVTTPCRNSPVDTTGILNFLVSSRVNGNCSSRAATWEFQHQWSDVTRENNCVANDIANSPFIVPTTTTHKTFWYIPNPPISCRIPPASTLKAAVMFEACQQETPTRPVIVSKMCSCLAATLASVSCGKQKEDSDYVIFHLVLYT